MAQISKVDYFVGVFLSSILGSAKGTPALFDEPNESKRVEFLAAPGYFNVYIKYSTTKSSTPYYDKGKEKIKYTCNIYFSDSEYKILTSFCKSGFRNCIAIIWANDSLTNTWIVMMDYEKAMKCLNSKTENGNRRIKITRYGGGHEFYCQGVDFKEDEYEKCKFDFMLFFKESPNKKSIAG